MRPVRYSVFLLLLSLPGLLRAQKDQRKAHRDSMMTYHNRQDTNYVRKYPNRLIITLTQSARIYDLTFSQFMLRDTGLYSSPEMIANARIATGATIDFDKISISFGLKTKPSTPTEIHDKGNTDYKTFNVSLGAYRFRFESSYRHYKGFFDQRAASYDTLNNKYYQDPSYDVNSLRLKTLFIFNKRKFSYNSAFYNTYRQVKSAGSWLLISNIYRLRIMSDSSLFPPVSQPYYDVLGGMDHFNAFGISLGPGASYNLVLFRLFYVNMTLTSGLDIQRLTYLDKQNEASSTTRWKHGSAGDFRAAIGMNNKNFFMSATYRVDYNAYRTDGFRVEPRYHSFDFNIGYRFPFKERKWVKKLKENKWYQLL